MLIYTSSDKIENMIKESEINTNRFSLGLNTLKIGSNVKGISMEAEIEPTSEGDFAKVIKSLHKKHKLKKMRQSTKINELSYIKANGLIKYTHFVDGKIASTLNKKELKLRSDNNFLADDILFFNIIIDHDVYDKIIIKCTAKNIQTFGWINWNGYKELEHSVVIYHPNSADPGILEKEIPVEFIVWVLETDEQNKSIIGSPILVYC